MNKVIVFGIDGGSLDLIKAWRKDLPAFDHIMNKGTWGNILSTVPALTCPAWISMFTGQNPAELGMYDFIDLKTFYPFNSFSYRGKAIWNDGIKCGLLNIPVTYPPLPMNGFTVSGMPHIFEENFTYPLDLREKLDLWCDGYEISPKVGVNIPNKESEYVGLINKTLDKREIALRMLLNEDWELFIYVENITDTAQHYFWKDMDKNHPRHKSNIFQYVIKDIYRRLDTILGNLITRDETVLVVSDHGFQSCYGSFLVNEWLEKEGYLKYKRKVSQFHLYDYRDRVMSKLTPNQIKLVQKCLPKFVQEKLRAFNAEKNQYVELLEQIDWGKTKAYALGTCGGIFLQDKSLRSEIIGKLVREGFIAYPKDYVFKGQFFDSAPDISILPNNYYPTAIKATPGEKQYCIDGIEGSGTHNRFNGIFMLYGKDIEAKQENISIYDIKDLILKELGK